MTGIGSKAAAITSQDANDRAEVSSLLRSRDKMSETFGRMSAVGDILDGSSQRLSQANDQLVEYGSKLDSASKVLGNLKRKSEEDSRYIWWSFLFFLSVVAYIVLRRLKVFRMLFFGASWGAWSGTKVAEILQASVVQIQGVAASLGLDV